MTDIVATDVVYTVLEENILDNGNLSVVVEIKFGNGTLTYPTGGIPLTRGKMGLPRHIKSLLLIDPESSDGLVYKFDLDNEKLRIYQGDYSVSTDGPLIELVGGSATPALDRIITAQVEGY